MLTSKRHAQFHSSRQEVEYYCCQILLQITKYTVQMCAVIRLGLKGVIVHNKQTNYSQMFLKKPKNVFSDFNLNTWTV